MKLKSTNVFKTNQIFDWQIVLYSAEKGSSSIAWLTVALNSVVPKLVRAVTQIKVAIMAYYPEYFAS